jgi:cobaltochelatase CobN
MHRLAAVPGLPEGPDADGQIPYVEQPPAPVLLLSSADTDLVACAELLARQPELLGVEARALNLAALSHPAVIDHYLASTVRHARLVLVRLLGGRGHWSYGLEQLQAWARQPGPDGGARQLLVLSGTPELDRELAALGTIPEPLALALADCLRVGGADNLRAVLQTLAALVAGKRPKPPAVVPAPDPLPHDWRDEPGARVGVILYRALHQAGDTELMEAVLAALRSRGLCPRGLWVSSLRDGAVQQGVGDLLERERAEAVLCGTGFASVSFEEAGLGAPLWDRLAVPVLQLLTSGRPRREWDQSAIGLGPLDLSLQVALPELDGRIGTRVGAFKEVVPSEGGGDREGSITGLATALQRLRPDPERVAWIASLTDNWIQLRHTPAERRRVALVLANYPTRNSRLANGVGLDTPASTAAMLQWLRQAGYDLGDGPLPADGEALIQRLLAGRSNDPESGHRPALEHLDLAAYQRWYQELPEAGRQRLEAVWGAPASDAGLERFVAPSPGAGTDPPSAQGFPVRGLRFGQVVVLIQPERGYDRDPSLSYHSPDLPPTHAYLAQYLWLRENFGAHVVVHVGKHGNLEWLPGKGVGLSDSCFPEWALGPLPHLYPFIVNDPGEGSQAKRRAQAVILDHLTPPLGRAGLHGDLQALESLLDEYWEARALGGERARGLRQRLAKELERLQLPEPAPSPVNSGALPDPDEGLDARLDRIDGYLCEIKEAQIRIGLHRFGSLPEGGALAELLLCLARPPQAGLCGLTQALARDLALELDPWADPEEGPLTEGDRRALAALPAWDPASSMDAPSQSDVPFQEAADGTTAPLLRCCGDGIARLEAWALQLMRRELTRRAVPAAAGGAGATDAHGTGCPTTTPSDGPFANSHGAFPPIGERTEAVLRHVRERLAPSLLACGEAEREAFLRGLDGGRITAGPSGAPTRGRPDLLPTGRNFYSVDLRGLPTEAAWDLGRRSAELLLDLHRLEQGEELRTLALSVWGTATMRNGGEDIAQALALMGVRPVWDGPTRRLVDLEVIPLALLGRPRVDVTLRISGLFRDAFPQLVGWINRATRLIASLAEEGAANPLAQAALVEGHCGRVFGSAPGAYGAGLQGLIDSGQWEERSDLAEAYLNWSQWRYDGEMLAGATGMVSPAADDALGQTGASGGIGLQARLDRGGLEERLAQVQVVLHNQDNREHDLLDSDDYYQFQGGLSAAVERLRGQAPALWFGDHSRRQRPRLHRLEKEFDKVLRSRLLNPRWIEAMQQHGYKGGFEMAASLDYLFAYDASTGRVPDWSYGALSRTWLADAEVLAFLRRHNPWALRDMAERLLEAQQRGLWAGAPAEELARLRQLLLESEALIESG